MVIGEDQRKVVMDLSPVAAAATEKKKKASKLKSKHSLASALPQTEAHTRKQSLVQATLMTNSSGIQLTYRGHGVLPMLSKSNYKNRGSLAASVAKARSNTKSQQVLIKPISHSQRQSMDLKKQLTSDNLKLMSRIVNAPPGIITYDQLQDHYRQYKKHKKSLRKIEKVVHHHQPHHKRASQHDQAAALQPSLLPSVTASATLMPENLAAPQSQSQANGPQISINGAVLPTIRQSTKKAHHI